MISEVHKMSFGSNLKRIRKEKNWSQNKLANKSGVTRDLISKYENDRCTPTVYVAYDIAVALGVPLEELVKVA